MHLAHRVPVDPQELEAFEERRVLQVFQVRQDSSDRRGTLVLLVSRAPLVFLVPLVSRETLVCLAFPDSLDQRENQESLEETDFLEILEMLELQVFLVTLVSPQLPSW